MYMPGTTVIDWDTLISQFENPAELGFCLDANSKQTTFYLGLFDSCCCGIGTGKYFKLRISIGSSTNN